MAETVWSEDDWKQERHIADFDRILASLNAWAEEAPAWTPFDRAKALLTRVEPRIRNLQINLDQVLVVGVLGGSGSGKSTLINALVGERVCEAGDIQRPTTRRPTIVTHPEVDPGFLDLEEIQPDVLERRLPILENLILIDCPDPDTQASGSQDHANQNRDILRRILPRCDVLLCLGTAQKYKTSAVADELLHHAPGRQVVFIQTHATEDADIRDDWRRYLEGLGFAVPPIFRIDSEDALARAERRQRPSESFEELQTFLRQELANRARHRIKRANVLDLAQWTVRQMRADIDPRLPALTQLDDAIDAQRRALLEKVRTHLTGRIRENQHLWRSRLLRQVSMAWGGGPFASFLWVVNSLSSILRFLPLSRARGLVPLVVAGSVAAGKSVADRFRETMAADDWVAGADLGVTQADMAQARSVLDGYAQSAELNRPATGELTTALTDDQRLAAARQLYQRTEAAIQEAISRRVTRRAGAIFHFLLEVLFLIVPGYLLYRLARNFFYEHPYLGQSLLGLEYWAQAAIWAVAWGLLLRGLLMLRLRRGLRRDIDSLLKSWSPDETLASLFADMRAATSRVRDHAARLHLIDAEVARLSDEFSSIELVSLGRLK